MTFKKIILGLCIAGLLSAPSFAKDKDKSDYMTTYMTKMTQSVGLSEDQASKIKSILESSRESIKKDNKNESSDHDRDAMIKKWKAVKTETNQKIEDVLSPEQKTKFTAFQSEQKKLRGKHMREMMLNHLAEKLHLSEEQRQKVGQTLETFQISAEKILTKETEITKEDKTALRELSKKRDTEIETVLTPNQKKTFTHLKKEFKNHNSFSHKERSGW